MFQQKHQSKQLERDDRARQAERLNVLAYRSVAVESLTESDIQAISRTAQSKNKAQGLTGVLLYDRGKFFQWLEGPTEALNQVWKRIVNDSRHCDIEVLRDEPCLERVFEEWDLRVVTGTTGSVDAAVAALDLPAVTLRRVVGKPHSVANLSLKELVFSVVIPGLVESRKHTAASGSAAMVSTQIWHAEPSCAENLAAELVSSRGDESRRFVDALLGQGASFNALYHEVFAPAQLALGRLSDSDQCNDFQLTVALARLQQEVHRVSLAVPTEHLSKANHSVLLCPQPRESHCVGLAMSAQVFMRSGWDVDCEFPADDTSLNALLQGQWFDVLQISLSGSLLRDGLLASMRTTIDSARSSSSNPSLIVMVDGRTFLERPRVYRAIHANAMVMSALNGVSVAEELLAASRSLAALPQVCVS